LASQRQADGKLVVSVPIIAIMTIVLARMGFDRTWAKAFHIIPFDLASGEFCEVVFVHECESKNYYNIRKER